ncbi:MAG: DJ-1/PfpI family protein [Actinobacteria bacterium]|nr:DJ-1/PfpI family protein [Actinomycetota bacterium]
MLVDIIAFDGVDELDVVGPLEVFRSAGELADIEARIVTRVAQARVTGAFGLRMETDGVFEPGRSDVLVVPGGGWAARADVSAYGEFQRGDLLPLLATAAQSTSMIVGICTGTLLLAHAGVVGDRRSNTHHTARADLAQTGATLVSDRVVDDGDLITCGGVTSGIDAALWVVERMCSRELADRAAERLEYQRWRPADAD